MNVSAQKRVLSPFYHFLETKWKRKHSQIILKLNRTKEFFELDQLLRKKKWNQFTSFLPDSLPMPCPKFWRSENGIRRS